MAKSTMNNQNQLTGISDNTVCMNNFITLINPDKPTTERVLTYMNDQFEEHETLKRNSAYKLDQDCTCMLLHQ